MLCVPCCRMQAVLDDADQSELLRCQRRCSDCLPCVYDAAASGPKLAQHDPTGARKCPWPREVSQWHTSVPTGLALVLTMGSI